MVQKVQIWFSLAGICKILSVNPAVNGYMFESGRIRQRNERNGLRLSYAVNVTTSL